MPLNRSLGAICSDVKMLNDDYAVTLNHMAKRKLPLKIIPGIIATNITDYFSGPINIIR